MYRLIIDFFKDSLRITFKKNYISRLSIKSYIEWLLVAFKVSKFYLLYFFYFKLTIEIDNNFTLPKFSPLILVELQVASCKQVARRYKFPIIILISVILLKKVNITIFYFYSMQHIYFLIKTIMVQVIYNRLQTS